MKIKKSTSIFILLILFCVGTINVTAQNPQFKFKFMIWKGTAESPTSNTLLGTFELDTFTAESDNPPNGFSSPDFFPNLNDINLQPGETITIRNMCKINGVNHSFNSNGLETTNADYGKIQVSLKNALGGDEQAIRPLAIIDYEGNYIDSIDHYLSWNYGETISVTLPNNLDSYYYFIFSNGIWINLYVPLCSSGGRFMMIKLNEPEDTGGDEPSNPGYVPHLHELLEADVFLGPNPTPNIVKLKINDFDPNRSYALKVFDRRGNLLLKKIITEAKTTYDIRRFRSGTYYFQISDNTCSDSTVTINRTIIKR